jgi:hypothetical protein
MKNLLQMEKINNQLMPFAGNAEKHCSQTGLSVHIAKLPDNWFV